MAPTPGSETESRHLPQEIAPSAVAPRLRARRDSLFFFLFGCTIFLLFGIGWMSLSRASLFDFRCVYASARTLLQHADPYDPAAVLRVYKAQGGFSPSNAPRDLLLVTHNDYLPSQFAISILFAMLPFTAAQLVWSALIAACCVLAAFLIWKNSIGHAPLVAGFLVCIFLVNSGSLNLGNASGLATNLCIVAACCFLSSRFLTIGMLCLAVSLALKPHDVGFIWLYFLLVNTCCRKRALQSLLLVVAMSLLMVFFIARVSPHWLSEMHANLAAFSHRGGINDPGPATSGGRGLFMITDLQAVFSFFKDDPLFYNTASLLVCAPLFLIWTVVTVRSRFSTRNAWLALAAVAALTLLPVYHRQYDAKLILLIVPACCILWSEGGRTGRWALFITAFTLVLNGDIAWLLIYRLFPRIHLSTESFYAAAPVPLSLLATGVFFLWVYARSASPRDDRGNDRATA